MKVALVTGVSSGIGQATALRLADLGYRTFGTVRNAVDPEPGIIELIRLDVRDGDSVQHGVATVFERAGRIDLLVNNAGTTVIGAAEETTPEEALEVFDTNFFGMMRMTQAVLPAMRKQGFGRIINISSLLGFLPAPFMSTYAATKHAVEGYSESLDHEVRKFGVRVIVVEPGFTRTNLVRETTNGRGMSEYRDDRERVAATLHRQIRSGVDPSAIAGIIARAAEAPNPALHYQAGRGARILRILRSIAPASVMDQGVRKTFGLGPSPGVRPPSPRSAGRGTLDRGHFGVAS